MKVKGAFQYSSRWNPLASSPQLGSMDQPFLCMIMNCTHVLGWFILFTLSINSCSGTILWSHKL